MLRFLILTALMGQLPLALAQEDIGNEAPPVFTTAQLIEDFDFMFQGLDSGSYDLYAFRERSEFESEHELIKAEIRQPMTRFEAEMAFQRFAALAHQAHTRVESDYSGFFSYLSGGGEIFPLDIAVEEGRLLVRGNSSGIEEIIPGDRITAIGDEAVTDLLPRLISHISAESPEFAYVLLENYLPLVLWLELGPNGAPSVSIEHGDGSTRNYNLAISQGVERGEDDTPAPFSLAGRDARMMAERVAYLRPGPFSNVEPGANALDAADYLEFVDSAFLDFLAKGADQLILDLRDNPGGHNAFSDPVIAWFADEPFRFASRFMIKVSPESTAANKARLASLPDGPNAISRLYAELYASRENGQRVEFVIPEVKPRSQPRFNGDVYVLVNRYSFSNAVSAAALIQDYGFGRVIGEQTVDMATTYGAMERFQLPHTEIIVTYPKALIIRPNGEDSIHAVTPDVPLPSPRIRTGVDELLNAALHYVQSVTAERSPKSVNGSK